MLSRLSIWKTKSCNYYQSKSNLGNFLCCWITMFNIQDGPRSCKLRSHDHKTHFLLFTCVEMVENTMLYLDLSWVWVAITMERQKLDCPSSISWHVSINHNKPMLYSKKCYIHSDTTTWMCFFLVAFSSLLWYKHLLGSLKPIVCLDYFFKESFRQVSDPSV